MSRTFERRTRMPVSAQSLYDWHARPGAFERLNPPFAPAEIELRNDGLDVGARTIVHIPVGPVKQKWVAVHTAHESGRMFRDEQVEGPFASWVHTHRFEPISDTQSELVDRIEYELPLGQLGSIFGTGFADDTLERTFAYRHAVTHADLLRHSKFADAPRRTIAITGSSGLIASSLIPFLTTGGHRVQPVTRKGDDFDASALEGADVVINLAGAGVADGRWSDARKKELVSSRVDYTQKLVEAAKKTRPKIWVQGSAVGIYGERGDEVLTEASAVGPAGEKEAKFLSKLCIDWEHAAAPVEQLGARLVHLRTGLVQTAQGGALAKMVPAFNFGVGGPIAGGKAWQSWVALEDLIGLIHFAMMTDSIEGPFNGVAPNPVTSADYAKTLGHVLRRPAIAPLPAFALRTLFGEMADGALLVSQRVVPEKAQRAGYEFLFPELEAALRFTLGR